MTLELVFATWLAATQPCVDSTRMVYVPAGAFWIGSDDAERQHAYSISSELVRQARWFEWELPRQQRALSGYCIDHTLVTQADYAVFVEATAHRVPGITRGEYQTQGFLVHDYDHAVTPYLWTGGQPPEGRETHPVVLVSATDAEAYCRWRDRSLRLPTEVEWERAARGDDAWIFPWGGSWDPDRVNSATAGPGGTTPVDRYPDGRSPYGLFDAVGNVFQWTSTPFGSDRWVVKGCAWDDDAGLCRPAFRHGRPPKSRHILFGFRCAGPAAP